MPQTAEEKKAYYRAYYLANKEQIKARNAAWQRENRIQVNDYNRAYDAANPDKRRSKILKKYGLTQELYASILESQGGCCPCGATEPGGSGTWHIDHDHATQRVRGLLCQQCNSGLGKLGDYYDEAIRRIELLRANAERTASILYPPKED